MTDLIKAIPQAATSPYALAAYAMAAIVFILVGARLRKLSMIMEQIKSLPAEERRRTIEIATETVLPASITAEDWIRLTRMRWLALLTGTVVVAIVVVATIALTSKPTAEFTKSEDTLTAVLKSSLVSDSVFQSQVRSLDKDLQAQIILKAARVLANEYYDVIKKQPKKFEAADFAHIELLIGFLLHMDRNNGHALYFSGEVKHHLNNDEQRKDAFYLYLETENGLPTNEKGGGKDIKLCTSRVHGYCQQRTGWIQHTLANFFIEKAQREHRIDQRREYYARALEFAKQALENYPPDGFEQLIPTNVVKVRAAKALQAK